MFAGWVYKTNLRPFLEVIVALTGGALDDDDWTAINYALFKAKPAENDIATRIDYQLSVRRSTSIGLQHELGTSVVEFELTSDPELETRADAVALVMQTYDVDRR